MTPIVPFTREADSRMVRVLISHASIIGLIPGRQCWHAFWSEWMNKYSLLAIVVISSACFSEKYEVKHTLFPFLTLIHLLNNFINSSLPKSNPRAMPENYRSPSTP